MQREYVSPSSLRGQLQSGDRRCDVRWNTSRTLRNSDDLCNILTDPKPDMFFGFPIYTPGPDGERGLERSELNRNFSLERLHSLREEGIACSPATGLGKNPPSTSSDDLVCFPFVVVELKHPLIGESQEQFCICQAANGASVALKMLVQLYKHADRHAEEVPPVVAFTCIGSKISVWLVKSIRPPGKIGAHVS